MPSEKTHNSQRPKGDKGTTYDAILNSAYEIFVDIGVRRTTMAAVANRAGVSRPTLYSYFNRIDDLVRALLTREVISVAERAYPLPRTGAELCETVVRMARVTRRNEFLTSIIENDSDLLVVYQFQRLGESQITLIRMLKNLITKLQKTDPGLRQDNPMTMATYMFITTQALVLSESALATTRSTSETSLDSASTAPNSSTDVSDTPAIWEKELTALLKGYIYS